MPTNSTEYMSLRQLIVGVLHQLNPQAAYRDSLKENNDLAFGQLGVDSLTAISFLHALNSKLTINVSAQELLRYNSVNALAKHLATQLSPAKQAKKAQYNNSINCAMTGAILLLNEPAEQSSLLSVASNINAILHKANSVLDRDISLGCIGLHSQLNQAIEKCWAEGNSNQITIQALDLSCDLQATSTSSRIQHALNQLALHAQQNSEPLRAFTHPFYLVLLPSSTTTPAPQVMLLSSHTLAKHCKLQPHALLSTIASADDAFSQARTIELLLADKHDVHKKTAGWATQQGWYCGSVSNATKGNRSENDTVSLRLLTALDCINQGRLPAGSIQVTTETQEYSSAPLANAQPWQIPPKSRLVAIVENAPSNDGVILLAHRKRLAAVKKTANNAPLRASQISAKPEKPLTDYQPFNWSSTHAKQNSDETSRLQVNSSQLNQSQLSLWLLQQARRDSTALNVPISLCVARKNQTNNPLSQLNFALQAVLKKHAVLRSQFNVNASQQHIDVGLFSPDAFSFEPLAIPSEATQNLTLPAQISAWQTQRLQQPFELKTAPLIRAYFHLKTNQVLCFFVIHHTIIDGYSGILFIKEFTAFYEKSGKESLEEKSKQTALDNIDTCDSAWQFTQQQNRYLQSHSVQQDKAFWREYLQDACSTMPLPVAEPTQQTHIAKLPLAANIPARLQAFTQQHSIAQPLLFIATLHQFLALLCDTQDTAFSVVTHGRPAPHLQQSIGCFINMVVCRAKHTKSTTINDFLQNLQQTYLRTLQHGQLPFAEQIRCLNRGDLDTQKAATGKAFNVNFAYQQFFSELTTQQASTALAGAQQDAQDEYSLEVIESRTGLQLQLKSTQFSAETLAQHLHFYQTLLQQILNTPEQLCSELRLAEPQQLTLHGAQSLPNKQQLCDTPFLDAVCQHAQQHPTRIAIQSTYETLTYAQLWQLIDYYSQIIAREVSQQFDVISSVNSTVNVAILAERRVETIALFMACWKLGITYTPIASDCSATRLKNVVDDTQLIALISVNDAEDSTLHAKASELPLARILVDPSKEALTNSRQPYKMEVLQTKANMTQLAYCLFTSGSTGKPKGVQVPLNAVNHYCWQFVEYFSLTAKDKMLQGAALTFDISVEEIFPILCAGGELHLLESGYQDIVAATRYIQHNGISIVSTVPAICARLAEMPSIGVLRAIISGGDTLRAENIAPLFHKYNANGQAVSIFNTYGPTETTVCATYQQLSPEHSCLSSLPIGHPVANTQLLVMDSQQRPVVTGVIGELWIHGPGLALGYVNQPELTAQSFVTWEGCIWYRTGDYVYYDKQQRLFFVGRKDQQLSIQGFRVEVAEVQQLIQQHTNVERAEVFTHVIEGMTHLCAVIQLTAATKLDNSIFTNLPAYMQPTLVAVMSEFPLTSNGKLDTKSLRQQVRPLMSVIHDNAESPTPTAKLTQVLNADEQQTFRKLRALWLEQLPHHQAANINEDSNWFQLGGHSLNAMRLMMRIEQQLSLSIPIQVLYEHSTLHAFARVVTQLASEHSTHSISTTTLATYRTDANTIFI